MKKFKVSELEFTGSFQHEKAVLFTREDFGADAKMQILSVKPGQTIPPHKHDKRTEAFYLVSGDGTIKINGEVALHTMDDVAICQPGDVHTMINNSEIEPFRILIFRTNDPGDEDMIWIEEEK